VKALGTCDVVMVLNFGMYSDSGTAWEAGFALGIGKECIQVLCGDDNTTYSLMMINGTNKVIHLENVANWEEESAWQPLNKIIQK
jgi:nucleoside 2-deoxyribosyltransferase